MVPSWRQKSFVKCVSYLATSITLTNSMITTTRVLNWGGETLIPSRSFGEKAGASVSIKGHFRGRAEDDKGYLEDDK